MSIIYNCIVIISTFFISVITVFQKKMKLFVNGRKETFSKLSVLQKSDKVVWIHAASLGEFEQGRPIIERFKKEHPTYKIVLTFFSPSGYEVQKNYKLADVICYLPMDTRKNVRRFLELTTPSIAIFIKYEFWPNYLRALKKRAIPTILISGIFRKNQSFFKPFGAFMRKSLKAFDYFFVQDENSQELLQTINHTNVSISGDTRFDRVYEILKQDNELDYISEFKNNQYTVVAGSTWKEDEELLVRYINNSTNEKFIIAPHNIYSDDIEKLIKQISKKVVLFSDKKDKNLAEYDVFVIDTIGVLTKVYSVADIAYVGGGLTKNGVHNILEPATFGIPIVIGPEYKKYKEVIDLVTLKGCKVISNQNQFNNIFSKLKTDELYRNQLGEINQYYIQQNVGATEKIITYINQKIIN